MSVANNIVKTTNLSTDQLVSVNRPVMVDFQFTSGTDVPVICEIQAYGNVNGNWIPIGSPLFSNRLSTSTAANPKFSIDFAEILSRGIGNTFKKSMRLIAGGSTTNVLKWIPTTDANALSEQLADSTHPDAEGTNSFKFYGTAWCVDSAGILTKSDSAAIAWNTTYVNPVNILIPTSFINGSHYSNLKDVAGLPLSGVLNGASNATMIASDKAFPTNCPRRLRRKIHHLAPLPLSYIIQDQGTNNLHTSIFALKVSDNSSINASLSLKSLGTANNFFTYLNHLSNMSALIANISNSSGIKDFVTIKSQVDGGSVYDELDFEMLNASNSLSSMPLNSRAIYWINDFQCLDYYLFDGTTEIVYENKSTEFFRNKDFKNGRLSNTGVHKASSTEHIKLKSSPLNKDGLIWLQEIGRSSAVFEYDFISASFLPIIINDFKTKVLGFKQDSFSTEISYVKSILATR